MAYNEGAAAPETWLSFLGELLYPEDIPTLQEFMGYCLLPTTKGQKLLMLIGRGGEGKSRIGLVLRALLGANMATAAWRRSRPAASPAPTWNTSWSCSTTT